MDGSDLTVVGVCNICTFLVQGCPSLVSNVRKFLENVKFSFTLMVKDCMYRIMVW